MNIEKELIKLSDKEYKNFISNLTPTVNKNRFLGVKIPDLKIFIKKINDSEITRFMNNLPHKYVEENIIHILLINKIKDINKCLDELDKLLPYLNSWVETDTGGGPKCFISNKDKVYKHLKLWLNDKKHTYTNRYGILTLMRYFLDIDFKVKDLNLVYKVNNDDKYIKLMKAWYYATALSKHYNETYEFIKNKVQDKDILKLTVKKANESYRISDKHKKELKKLLNDKTRV